MKPSSRMDYALKALVDLALHQGTGPVTVASIAKRQTIPGRYLEQLFNRLRRTGIVWRLAMLATVTGPVP